MPRTDYAPDYYGDIVHGGGHESRTDPRMSPRLPRQRYAPQPVDVYNPYPSENRRHPPPYEAFERNSSRDVEKKALSSEEASQRDDRSSDSKRSKGKKAKEKAASFAESTTVAGLIWIKNATTWYARAFWILAFAGMLAVLVWHLYYITNRYYSYPFVTKFSIRTDAAADFPSVTICNLNPIKISKLSEDPDVAEFVGQLVDVFDRDIRYQVPGPPDNANSTDDASTDYYDYHITDYFGGVFGSLDDVFHYGSMFDDQDQGFTGGTDSSILLDNQLKELIGEIDPKTRKRMGHDSRLMILKCTFNGKTCYSNNFTHTFAESYGNCYTFNSVAANNISYSTRFVGAIHGLSLQLYLESSEYLRGVTPGRGFRVAIHPYGTLPFPDELGYSVAAGMETFVGIRQRKFKRLNEPYAPCEEGESFQQKYKALYTKKTCSSMCTDSLIAKTCRCWTGQRIEYYAAADITTLPRCSSTASLTECQTNITNQVRVGNTQCACERECSVIDYTRQISSNVWPDSGLFTTLGSLLCNKDEGGSGCKAMTYAGESYMVQPNGSEVAVGPAAEIDLDWFLRKNFAKLNVYFNDLNYDDIVEEAEYPLSNFAADIGGTIGLWLGLSIFSVIEIIMLLVVLFKVVGSNLRGQLPQGQQQKNQSRAPTQHPSPDYDSGDKSAALRRFPLQSSGFTDSGPHHQNWGRPLPQYFENPNAYRF